LHANSPPVRSTQNAPHKRLCEVVLRHLREPYRRKPSDASRSAFAAIVDSLRAPFVLDAGCGTGAGTFALAREYPGRFVLGVDKSAARLAIGQRRIDAGEAPANARLLRCGLVDFWQLAAESALRCKRQLLLYPNPWPKPEHLKRRWHAHPVLPAILALGGEIELRTNWRVYAEEFAEALRLAGVAAQCEKFAIHEAPLTPFERKYAASGHDLWRCLANAARVRSVP
jgi:tRNA G46 methylase TrmB